MIMRLVWIETRRNFAIWLVPVILLVAWWLLAVRGWIPIFWNSTNASLLEPTLPFAAPAMAGAAAWVAGRERRRKTVDLLATTPMPALKRSLAALTATAFWGAIPCLIFAAFLMGWTASVATWGSPDLWPIPTIIVTVMAFAAWGYAAGTLIPSRLTAPTVATICFAIVLYFTNYTQATGGGFQQNWVTNLAPDHSNPAWAHWHILIYVGLAGAGLGLIALGYQRRVIPVLLIAVSLSISVLAASMMRQAWIDQAHNVVFSTSNGGPSAPPDIVRPPEPQVCSGEPIEVCVHPRLQPLLDEAIEHVNALAAPLEGLPGVPTQARPQDVPFTGGGSTSMFEIGSDARLDATSFANRLVAETVDNGGEQLTNTAQIAIRSWLLENADIDSYLRCDDARALSWQVPGQPNTETCEVTSRFSSLSVTEQRNWLETNYAALRAGDIDLDDLP